MTKEQYDQMRFQAACAAMTGLLLDHDENRAAECSVRLAGALLKELGVEEPKE